MWQRFELFWTAFEKFALFFAFVGTLVALVALVMIYNGIVRLETSSFPTPAPTWTPTPIPPTPTPLPTLPVEPLIRTVEDALVKIQGSVSTSTVSISHTVPIQLDIRINPEQTDLKLVGTGELKAGQLVINLDDAGELIGKSAVFKLSDGNTFKVKLDVSKQVVFDVPIEVTVPVRVPSSVDLSKEIDALKTISMTVQAASTAIPQAARTVP
jgi:hypothetical protein